MSYEEKTLDEISSKIVNKFVKKSNLSDNQIKEIIEKEINTSNELSNENTSYKKISILFNNLNKNYDYSKISFNSVENIYIPISLL